MNDNELMNRRRFFKKTAKEILPMLGTFVVAPTVIMTTLTACPSDVCDGCEAACRDNCVDTCKGNCYTACANSSAGGECSDCSSTCSNSSTSNSCSSCANDCSSACTGTCSDNCEGTCSETCQGQCSETCKDTCSATCEGTSSGKPTTGTINGHEYVDLGLSVLWATCNIGAVKNEDKGDKFPFVLSEYYKEGEEFEKKQKEWHDKFVELKLRKEQSICGTSFDVARKKWGSKWRMPSRDEAEELRSNCRIELIPTIGLKFISNINDESIVFPFTDYTTVDNSSYSYLWTGDISEEPEEAFAMLFIEKSNPYGVPWMNIVKSHVEIVIEHLISEYEYIVEINNIRPVVERQNGTGNCNNSCTANCSSDCVSTCKNKCTESCKDTCIGDCVGGCGTGCANSCSGSCSSTCTGSCSSTCTGTCSSTCTGNCKGGCSGGCTGCTGGCSSSCTGECTGGCKGGCSSTCTTNCAQNCASGCSSGCSGGCSSGCYTGCTGGCDGSCYYGCSGSCGTGCGVSCSGGCDGTCTGSCSGRCRGLNITAW